MSKELTLPYDLRLPIMQHTLDEAVDIAASHNFDTFDPLHMPLDPSLAAVQLEMRDTEYRTAKTRQGLLAVDVQNDMIATRRVDSPNEHPNLWLQWNDRRGTRHDVLSRPVGQLVFRRTSNSMWQLTAPDEENALCVLEPRGILVYILQIGDGVRKRFDRH